ncbi:rhodanese-like domain-containing protein [Pelagibius marinus]|uniref:rhodanese-like domain-containing protein n=1 Tax=Pelagibius marinus TaxID=2762760 RepID=UPI0018730BF6|nr:rhodanese-like domain-containing protein [Pelagibius marinus]
MSREVSAVEAKTRVHDGAEIAFLDVREAGEFGEGHPLFAIPCPYSRLEARIAALAPRRSVRVLLIDGGDGVAARAAQTLESLGYGDVAWVGGGVAAWAAAGFGVFKGVNVPSKTLGELAEHAWHPETITAPMLKRWQDEGRVIRFFDCRPPAEYAKMRVPGAVCLPNGELAHRFPVAAPEAETPVVVTCAGRTRSIVGALGLRLAGVEAPVYALENGTQGWQLAGYKLERGNTPAPYPELDPAGAAATRARAEVLLARQGIAVADRAAVEAWRAEAGRSTYLFDLRAPQEIAAAPAPAFIPALSGQLVQATDQWVGVRHARLVLLDDLGLRGAIAAFWLRQLGYEVAVACFDAELAALPPGKGAPTLPAVEPVEAAAAWRAVRAGEAQLVDVRASTAFQVGHAAGALWGIRPRLDRLPLDRARAVYLVGDEAAVTALAAAELRALGQAAVFAVSGGQDALSAAGAEVEASPESPGREEAIDFLWFVHDRHDGNLDASRAYLAWEQGLIAQLDAEERAAFALAQTPPG